MSRYTRFPAEGVPAGARPAGPPAPAGAPAPAPAGAPPAGRRAAPAARALPGAGAAPAVRVPRPLLFFLIALALPFTFNVGPLALSPARLMLLALIVPLLVAWWSGACGPKRLPDWLLIAYLAWQTISWLHWGGVDMIEYAGVLVVESLGAYLVARRYVRDEASYRGMIRVFFWMGIVLGASAAIEAVTFVRPVVMLFDPVFDTFYRRIDIRMGMQRSQTSFEHPILSGVFIMMMLTPLYTALRTGGTLVRAVLGVLPVMAGVFFSLSSGALLGMTVQVGILVWGTVLHDKPWRWKVLAALTALAYVTVDLLSNRTPFEVFISYATFNQGTGYHRILIFIYGMDHVWVSPIFGSGFDEWARPEWLHSSSVDNFWLVVAMRHGVPGFVLIALFYASVAAALIRARPLSPHIRLHREAIAIVLVAMFLALCTVHVWGSTAVFVFFVLGLHGWVSDAPREGEGEGEAEEAPDPGPGGRLRGAGGVTARGAGAATRRAPGRPPSDRGRRAEARRPSRS